MLESVLVEAPIAVFMIICDQPYFVFKFVELVKLDYLDPLDRKKLYNFFFAGIRFPQVCHSCFHSNAKVVWLWDTLVWNER